jgi:AcrR family transcriptional regulator
MFVMAMKTASSERSSADDRREQVLEAAVHEFAEHGYHAARTAAIATRAGISQPYIYALFKDKKTLFLACQDLVDDRVRAAFAAALRPADSPADSFKQLGSGYRKYLGNTDLLRCRMQGYAAAADPEIREHMRRAFIHTFDMLMAMTGADSAMVARFFATGLLLSVGGVLDLPEAYQFAPPW